MKILSQSSKGLFNPASRARLLAVSAALAMTAGVAGAQTVHQHNSASSNIFVSPSAGTAFKENVPPLGDFLLRRLNALTLLENTPSNELQPVTLQAYTTAEQRAGVRRIRIRGFQIVSDSGPDYAGYDLGPSSPESAQAVVASDIADTYISQAALRGIRIDSLEVTIGSYPDPDAPRVPHPTHLGYTAYIVSPASDAQLEELRKAVEENSALFNLVSRPQVVEGDIDYTKTPEKLVIPEGFQPGLREYLKYKRNAYLYKQSQAAARQNANGQQVQRRTAPFTQEDALRFERIHVKVEGGTGIRRVHIRQFEILHDNPAYLAGNDLGPSAPEHQLGVLTSCLTHIFLIQAAAQQVRLDTLVVSVKGTVDPRAGRPGFEDVPRYPHHINYTVHAKTPESLDKIKKLRDDVEAVCPIYNLLRHEVLITGRVVRPNKH
jgi:uncharacterized OsmC-like protein